MDAYRAALLAPLPTAAAWRALAASLLDELRATDTPEGADDLIAAYRRAVGDCYSRAGSIDRAEHPWRYAPHAVGPGWVVEASPSREVTRWTEEAS